MSHDREASDEQSRVYLYALKSLANIAKHLLGIIHDV